MSDLERAAERLLESLGDGRTPKIESAKAALEAAEERGRQEVEREALESVAEILDSIAKPVRELREEIHQKLMEIKP